MELVKIATAITPFDEKFGLPRQANLVKSRTLLKFENEFNDPNAILGLEDFSHCWIIFGFHLHTQKIAEKTPLMARPPRLGGNKKVGVFASRSPFRPNGLGLSKGKILEIFVKDNNLYIALESSDLVNGTPIYDIKPYIAYSDSEIDAKCSFAQEKPNAPLRVEFSSEVKQAMSKKEIFANFQKFNINEPLDFIQDVLRQDPRPSYRQDKEDHNEYGIALCGLNIRFKMKNLYTIEVLTIA